MGGVKKRERERSKRNGVKERRKRESERSVKEEK